jgi:hypothetical protein
MEYPKNDVLGKSLASPWDRVEHFGTHLGGGWDIACHKCGVLFSTSGKYPKSMAFLGKGFSTTTFSRHIDT